MTVSSVNLPVTAPVVENDTIGTPTDQSALATQATHSVLPNTPVRPPGRKGEHAKLLSHGKKASDTKTERPNPGNPGIALGCGLAAAFIGMQRDTQETVVQPLHAFVATLQAQGTRPADLIKAMIHLLQNSEPPGAKVDDGK